MTDPTPQTSPAIHTPEDGPGWACDVYLDTTHVLDEAFDVDEDLAEAFEAFRGTPACPDGSWFEDGEAFMETTARTEGGQPYVQVARDNTYNGEQDLSEQYVWEVYTPEGEEDDWHYNPEAVVVVYLHRGGDVRGNYGAPQFFRPAGEVVVPTWQVVEWHAESATRGCLDFTAEAEEANEELCAGYSGHPTTHAESLGFNMSDGRWEGGRYTTRGPNGGWYYLTPGAPYFG